MAALAGFFAMTLSPVEGVALASIPAGLPGLIGSNLENIVGGAITAPICGLVGQRARAGRWWPAPSWSRARSAWSRSPGRQPAGSSQPMIVWHAEIAAGLAVGLAAAITASMTRRAGAT